MSDDLSFPIGKHDKNSEITIEQRNQFINEIAELPEKLRGAAENLTDEQLDTAYRPDGWTIRQTVHHVGDSHLNSFIRFKLALTEDAPVIRPYAEEKWAETGEYKMPVDVSLRLIEALHERWANLLNSMSDADFARKLVHPDSGDWTLGKMLGLYAWHGKHHTAHITKLRERNNWL